MRTFTELKERFLYLGMIASMLFFSFICLLPFIMVVSGSLTNENTLIANGLRLIPSEISFASYQALLSFPSKIVNAYKITILVTLIGSILSVFVNALMAYALSKKSLLYTRQIAFYATFTMLFNGGMVPWYIICVKYLHLNDNLIGLILPYAANAWYMFLLRNYFRGIPEEVAESAAIDGASEYLIFFKIMLPLSTPAIATVTLFTSLGYWNDWYLGMMFISKEHLVPLQLLLRSIISNIQFLTSGVAAGTAASNVTLPSEGIKMATTIITIGPIIFLYPFLQRYFIKGLLVGSVKG